MAFRVDASDRMGIGHFMRCLTLAESVRAKGGNVEFICRAHAGNLIEILRERDIKATLLPAPSQKLAAGHREDYRLWLGVPPEEDADETIKALRGKQPDWLIVDHYGIDIAWERMVRLHAPRIMVIDDLLSRVHDCDLFLDQNESGCTEERYRARVPATCRLALGARYALLRPEYRDYRAADRRDSSGLRRVMVFLGGSDPADMTGLVLKALSDPEFDHLFVDIVIGPNNLHRSALELAAAGRAQTRVYGPQLHLAGLMAQADLAIGAGGTTTWERMCLGLPSLVISIAENQRSGCESLAQKELIYYLGAASEIRVADVREALRVFMRSPQILAEFSRKSRAMVDGLGAQRMAESLAPTPVEELSLRVTQDDDVDLYFGWVNDPEVRRQSLKSAPIALSQHREWFAEKMLSPQSELFVMVAGTLPVAQIRFDLKGAEYWIDYSIDLLYRGRGWAQHLVMLGMRRILERGPATFRAEVKRGNAVSRSVFGRLGFTEQVASGDAASSVFLLKSATAQVMSDP